MRRHKELIMKLRDTISGDLTAAMKAKEPLRLSVLRMMKSAVQLRETEVRAQLEDAQTIQVLATLIKQRKDSIEQFTAGGRPELAEKEAAEIKIIEEYLRRSHPGDGRFFAERHGRRHEAMHDALRRPAGRRQGRERRCAPPPRTQKLKPRNVRNTEA
jgi:hypothetical protein